VNCNALCFLALCRFSSDFSWLLARDERDYSAPWPRRSVGLDGGGEQRHFVAANRTFVQRSCHPQYSHCYACGIDIVVFERLERNYTFVYSGGVTFSYTDGLLQNNFSHWNSLPVITFVLSGVWGGGVGGFNPPKFRRSSKIVSNSTRLWKQLKIAEFRTPTPQDVRKKGSKILKLPPVRNYFTLAMTNKLVVIINSLKVPKIKKILLHEMKFLVPNYSCLQKPWVGATAPRSPFCLSSVHN